jgi:hypothetical protein
MKSLFAIAGIFLLINFVASAQIPSDANLRLQIYSLSSTNLSGIVSNTKTDVQYEFRYRQSRSNWVSLGFIFGSETTNWTAFDFRITNAIDRKKIRVRSWEDSDGNGIADWWELRYFGTVGVDPYGNPAGDGWNNLQKFQNRMDTEDWYRPREPVANIAFQPGSDIRHQNSILTWRYNNGPIPDFVVIERANRALRPMTNNFPSRRYPVYNNAFTNRPLPPVLPMNNRLGWQQQPSLITGPYEVIARVPGHDKASF